MGHFLCDLLRWCKKMGADENLAPFNLLELLFVLISFFEKYSLDVSRWIMGD